LLPLANTVTWIFLSGTGVVSVGETSIPYPVYVFTGTMLWAVFMDAMNAPLQQTTAAKSMLAKLNFPREAILLSGIYQTLFNGAIKIALLLAALLFLGINPGWGLLLFPLGVLSLILMGTAVGVRPRNNVLISSIQNRIGRFSARTEPSVRRCGPARAG
jgi:lipopolysaccharide transport system permease protein